MTRTFETSCGFMTFLFLHYYVSVSFSVVLMFLLDYYLSVYCIVVIDGLLILQYI